jgi:hypothetical protein
MTSQGMYSIVVLGRVAAAVWVIAAAPGTVVVQAAKAAVQRAATEAIAAQAATQRKERRQPTSHRQWQTRARMMRAETQSAGVT